MTACRVVAFASGVCIWCSLGGAASALTAVRPTCMLATGIALLFCALNRRSAREAFPYAIVGALAGLLLPSTPPPVAGAVVTRAARVPMRGDLFEMLDRLDADPSRVIGRRISVSGEWTPESSDRLATVSRRVMSCCAADSIAVGFDVAPRDRPRWRAGARVRVDGIVVQRIRDGENRFVLEQSRVARLEDWSNRAR